MDTSKKDIEFSIQFNADIAKDSNGIRIAFYANIGFFIEVAQMLEFNLRKLICYEKSVKEIVATEISKENVERICKKYDKYYDVTYFERYTLGKLKKEVEKQCSINKEFIDIIGEINDYRVQVVHKIFQNNVILKSFESADYVKAYTNNRIIPMTNKAIEVNKTILKIMNLFRDDLHKYKHQVGIPFIE